MRFHGALALWVLGLASPLGADVRHVAQDGTGDFVQIQHAVNAAQDGDVILVHPGDYASFVADDKALEIRAFAGGVTCGAVRVRNLAAGKRFSVHGLDAVGTTGLTANNCQGLLVFEDCRFQGAPGSPCADVDLCSALVMTSCMVQADPDVGSGGPGIDALNSSLALYESAVIGGPGDDSSISGGDGARLSGSFLFASGTWFEGGWTPFAPLCPPMPGGDGIDLRSGSEAQLLDCTRKGGPGGNCGGLFPEDGVNGWPLRQDASSSHVDLPGSARTLEASPLAQEGAGGAITCRGEPGELVTLYWDPVSDFAWRPDLDGVLCLTQPLSARPPLRGARVDGPAGPPFSAGGVVLGLLPPDGVLTVPFGLAGLPPGIGTSLGLQAVFRGGAGELRLSSPRLLGVLGCAQRNRADCNANGQPDGCDVARLRSEDCNADGIPDECQGFPDCNGNAVPDLCDIEQGTSTDCDGDGVPDECGPFLDCNGNGVVDACDLEAGTSTDCDADGVPDECQPLADCNGNGVPDACDIQSGGSSDNNGDGIPDECQRRLYVSASAAPGGDGLSWTRALPSLMDALAAANAAGGVIQEVWVAAGTYRPAPPGGSRWSSFVLGPFSLYGGFAGGETSLDQRDLLANPTVLSGDLDGDDGPGFTNRGDNSYHVLRTDGSTYVERRLDGFFLRGGEASGALGERKGGAAWISRPTRIANCTFLDNRAWTEGGAVHVGVFTYVVNCRFLGNRAGESGTIGFGGAASGVSGAGGQFHGCEFSGNRAEDQGGGLFWVGPGSSLTVTASSFAGNHAESGGGIVCAGGTTAKVRNSVLFGNTDLGGGGEDAQLRLPSGSEVAYCCVEAAAPLPGAGNLALDPSFVAPLGPDGVAGTLDDDLRLQASSPCIDAGANNLLPADTLDVDNDGNLYEPLPLDLDGQPRRADLPGVPDTGAGNAPIVDMGAYERQP